MCTFVAVDGLLVRQIEGFRHFIDKKWSMTFALATALCWADWLCFYGAAAHHMFRFSRMFRPLLFVSRFASLRRLLSTMLRTFFATIDVTLVFVVVTLFLAQLGMQLFNNYDVRWGNLHT